MSGTKRISALTELASGSVDEDDILAIVDMSQASVTDKTKHVKVKNLIAVGGRLEIDSFAELATKFVGSSPSSTQQIAATNDIVVWREKGFRYQCVTSGEHFDYTGSGGLKWKVLPGLYGYNLQAFGAAGDGTTDDTATVQKWLDAVGDTDYGVAASFAVASPARGNICFAPAGDYRLTSTVEINNNTVLQGSGWGTKFKIDPSSANTDGFKTRTFVSGNAMNAINARIMDCAIYAAPDGSTTTGRNGSPLNTVNSNTRDGIRCEDAGPGIICERVLFSDFHYGRGYYAGTPNASFSYYNALIACQFRDCFQAYKLTSATGVISCYVGHSTRFPAQSRMSLHEYALDLDGAAGCKISGSIETYSSVATIRDNGRGHDFSGLYLESFTPTPAVFDCETLPSSALSLNHGATSYGFTYHKLVNNLISRSGSDQINIGMNFGCGDYEELELYHQTTGQSPSFRAGLPGRGHFPSGGTLTTEQNSFVDRSCLVLTRGAGTSATNNQMSYVFKIRGGKKFVSNIWITLLVKPEGGEVDFTIQMSVSPTTANFKKLFTYSNGWQLWGTYLAPNEDQSYTLFVTQTAGSTDSARRLLVTGLRAYANGFAPMPAPYRWEEYRTAAPTDGEWLRSDRVWNAQPSSGGAPGWVCVFNLTTTLTADEPSGETSMAVTSGTGTSNGDIIGVEQDDGTVKWTTISSGGGTTTLVLTSGLTADAATGNAVYIYRFKAMANLA